MHSPSIRTRLAVTHQLKIGRLAMDIAVAERRLTCSTQLVERICDPSYLLVIPLNASLSFVQNGRSGLVQVGEYVLLGQNSFYELSSEPGHQLLMLRIPLSDLRGRLVTVEDHISRRFEPNRALSRLLVDLIKGVSESFADKDPPNSEALATEIIGFIALTIESEDRGAAVDVRNGRYQLRRRIFEFIEKNLNDEGLSPRMIAQSMRISMSYLYSLFSDDNTTITQFVREKRLQRAYEVLVADTRGHRTVSEIAYEVGFKNVSHFSRSFSRHFGIAPRDARQVCQLEAISMRRLETQSAHA
jgi:AraC-like DNA-binding protein